MHIKEFLSIVPALFFFGCAGTWDVLYGDSRAAIERAHEMAAIPDPPEPQPGEEDPGAVVAVIKQNQRAPFTGLLFSPQAAAETIAEIKTQREQCDIDCKFQLDMLKAQHALELQRAQNDYSALEKGCEVRVQTRDETIKFMDDRMREMADPNTELWFTLGAGGGLVTGIVLSLATFAIYQEAAK